MPRVCYKISTLVARIKSEPGLRMKGNYPIELCVSTYALLCVSMPSRHKESLEITASCFTDAVKIKDIGQIIGDPLYPLPSQFTDAP